MKRIGKFSALLIAVALVSPTLAHGVDSYDEQHLASPAPAKNYQGYLLQDAAEITRFNSGLISFKLASNLSVESITACSSLSQAGCEFTARSCQAGSPEENNDHLCKGKDEQESHSSYSKMSDGV